LLETEFNFSECAVPIEKTINPKTKLYFVILIPLIYIASAMAEGLIGFDEVMQFDAQNRKLIGEIEGSIRDQYLSRTDIQCDAARYARADIHPVLRKLQRRSPLLIGHGLAEGLKAGMQNSANLVSSELNMKDEFCDESYLK
jgi:hypothetical protein